MSELDILTQYLKDHNIPFERYDCSKEDFEADGEYTFYIDRHQICVPNQQYILWDVICQEGSYGYRDGLLEAFGDIVEVDDAVEGYLTAQDIIERIEKHQYSMASIGAWLLSKTQNKMGIESNEDLDRGQGVCITQYAYHPNEKIKTRIWLVEQQTH